MTNPDELDRLRQEYAARDHRLSGSDIYSPFNPAALYSYQERQRVLLATLRRFGYYPLHERRVLELGCGTGGVLIEYLGYGVVSTNLHGADLIINRVHQAHSRLRHLPLICADGQRLPYPTDSFDLILQYTVFTSVLDEGIKQTLASEMNRVLNPGGIVVWYDFMYNNPQNPNVRGIKAGEIRSLFPGYTMHLKRITLAPPIARRIPESLLSVFYPLFSAVPLLRTHYLGLLISPTSKL